MRHQAIHRVRGIVDASAFSGRPTGPMVVAQQLVDAWSRHRPEDAITAWMPGSDNVSTFERLGRHLSRTRRAFGPPDALDFYLSLNPTLPPRVPTDVLTGVVIFDQRHLAEPHHFSAHQRLYRNALWRAGVRRADVVFTAAQAAGGAGQAVAGDLGRSPVVIPLGSDHVRSISRTNDNPAVVALCHRANKPPEVALDVWRSARSIDRAVPPLVLIGVDDEQHRALESSLTDDEQGEVSMHGRLDQAAFDAQLGSAQALLFLSSHEGYGLPLAEGLQLGIPVVAFELPALRQLAGPDYPLAAPGDRAAAARLLVEAVGPNPPTYVVDLATWADTVEGIRSAFIEHMTADRALLPLAEARR